MTPQVLAFLVAAHVCGQPTQTFREFYAAHYFESKDYWAGMELEDRSIVTKRVLNAEADYIDYRFGVMEKCR